MPGFVGIRAGESETPGSICVEGGGSRWVIARLA